MTLSEVTRAQLAKGMDRQSMHMKIRGAFAYRETLHGATCAMATYLPQCSMEEVLLYSG